MSKKNHQIRSYRLKRDIVIPAGTVFQGIDGEHREYHYGNISTLVGLTKDSCGEFIYEVGEDTKDYFEETK